MATLISILQTKLSLHCIKYIFNCTVLYYMLCCTGLQSCIIYLSTDSARVRFNPGV